MSSRKQLRRSVSLARALSKLGYTSRAQAEPLILAGRVKVNDQTAVNPSLRCDLNYDRIAVDGIRLRKKKFVYIIMNKPVGAVTTRSDERGRKTVYDLIGDLGRWVFPVGRLDKDTAGLLLFTNDNRLGEHLTNPRSKVPKTYVVQLDKPFSEEHVQVFRRGMMLDGERLQPARVRLVNDNCIELTIVEGRNRQVRRMCEAVGYCVLALTRTKIGGLEFPDMKTGEWRGLSEAEVQKLRRWQLRKVEMWNDVRSTSRRPEAHLRLRRMSLRLKPLAENTGVTEYRNGTMESIGVEE